MGNLEAQPSKLAIEQTRNSAADATANWGWDTLPTEIKLQVLRDRLVILNPVNYKSHPIHSRRCLLPLLLTNKKMHDLAAEVYYGDNTIRLETNGKDGMSLNMFSLPNFAHGHRVRKLELHVQLQGIYEPKLCLSFKKDCSWPAQVNDQYGLLLLMEPWRGADGWKERQRTYIIPIRKPEFNRYQGSPRFAPSAGWQEHFPSVRNLKVVFSGARCFNGGYWGYFERRDFLRLPEFARIPIKPVSVEVVVQNIGPITKCCEETGGLRCGFKCTEIWKQWETVVKGMVQLRTPE